MRGWLLVKVANLFLIVFLEKCNFFDLIFCGFQKKCYLCIAIEKSMRAFSSAGSEHLPYKQRVGGSNPSTPTKEKELLQK